MRKKLKSFLSSLVAALLLATLIVPIAACDDSGSTTVSVLSMGNKGLEGVTVTATSGSTTLQGTTNSKGNVTFNIDKSLNYTVTFDDLPKGYYADPSKSYKIKANSSDTVKFYLPSQVIKGESVGSTYVYKTGDVMYDFSFTTTIGSKVITLSEELEHKKAVLINFWGSQCYNCQVEFPAIEKTYQMFKNDLTVMAIDPPLAYGDDNDTIGRTLSSWKLSLSFYYGLDSANIFKNFFAPAQNNKYELPVSAIIDRYGVVCEIIVGSESDESKWQRAIAKYVADDYVPDIKDGQSAEDVENFVPDLPANFNAQMSNEKDINKAINNTGANIHFYADDGEYSWPWALSKSGDSIVPLGSGHGRSYSIIYADININTDHALLVDYKVSSEEDYDLFEIVVDNNDLGRLTFTDSGNKDWQTALAYVPLSSGNHQIAFVYYKGTIEGDYEDTVYLKNLRIVEATSDKVPSADISYYAARDYNTKYDEYNTYEEVYFDDTDGYYHIKGRESAGKDPYLLLDMTHIIPYTRDASLYEKYISTNNCKFGNKNYYNELISYSHVSGNSAVEGAVPVTKELHDIIVALCKHEFGSASYNANPNLWLEFCIFYMHYGEGDAIDDPAKGLAYFSAYEAKETIVYDSVQMQAWADSVNNAISAKNKALEENADADTSAYDEIIERDTALYENYLDKSDNFNKVDFDTIIIPRGKLIKFTATSNGVYHFYSVGREDKADYVCEAQLYNGDLKLHTALAKPVASHDSDTLFRYDKDPKQFHIYRYLKAGESCYLNLMYYSTDTMGTMYVAINKVHDTEYKTLKTVTAGYYTSSLDADTLGKIYRPLYVKGIELKGDDYYETSFNHKIFVDFTGYTRHSTVHTLEKIIRAGESADFPEIKIPTEVDDDGNVTKTISVNFDLRGSTLTIGGETIVGEDYTQKMKDYLAQSKLVGVDDPNYGLIEANKELRDILLLFIDKYDGLEVEEDWLTFCYFYEYFGANY